MTAHHGSTHRRTFFRRRGPLLFAGLAILMLVGARLALPSVIKRTVNARLNELPTHRAHIEGVGLREITRLEVRRGIVRYRDLEQTPPIDLALHNVSATVDGLAFGAASADDRLPARADLHAFAPGSGHLRLVATGDPAARPPVFEIAAELSESDLTAYSELVNARLGVDVSAGKLHISFEATAKDGRYEGYLKPLISGAQFEEPNEGLLSTLWAKIVNTMSEALTNDETRQMGTRVPFSGNFEENDVEAWPTFIALLQNAFGRALREGVDGQTEAASR